MTNQPKQQLRMLWPEHLLESPPELILPAEYALRTFQPGDETEYLKLMGEVGFASDRDALKKYFALVLPDSFFVVVHRSSGQIVATAMASHNPMPLHPFAGELGWVAGSPEHAGKRLGKAVCTAVTARLLSIGYRRIYLRTDDWRLPALKTYLRLGYVPFLFAPDMESRWKAVCTKLDWPFTPNDWPRYRPPEEELLARQDLDTLNRYPRRHQWIPDRPHRGYSLAGDVDAFGDESLYQPSRLGIASATPDKAVAGEIAPLRLTFTAGADGLPQGAQVTFVMRGQRPLGRRWNDYALAGPEGCVLGPAEKGFGFALKQGHLKKGQSVELVIEPFRWTPLAGQREFKVVIDYKKSKPQRRLPEPVVIDLLPGSLDHLEATLPATHRAGETLPLHVTARDEHDNRVAYTGVVEAQFSEQRQSVYMVEGMAKCRVAASVGSPLQVTARIKSPPLQCESNPSVETDGLQLYIGDLHCHDFFSEAEGYPDEVYRWAMEERRLDFVSIVPQVHGWLDNEKWAVVKYMNERYLKEGQFVTFLGFEWQHSGYGDKVIHYLGGDQPYLPVDDRRYNNPAKLYQVLRASDALIISHHPGYPVGAWVPGTDFDCVESDVERLVELWSMHGSSEGYDPSDRPLVGAASGSGVMTALRNGMRLGFVAGSDTHSGRAGGSAKEPRPYWGGLAAVWAQNLTRRDVFHALRARHTYALTGARIVLKMTVNGALMGSEISACDRVGIHIDAWTPGKIEQVQVLKNAQLLQCFTPGGDECHIQLEDRTAGAAFYHCRLIQTDGQLAVCSPVWVG